MNYRRLGAAGIKISEIGLGGWLTFGNALGQDTAAQIISKAFDLGINFFDTANVYALGKCEEVWGTLFKRHRRDDFVLATKVYFQMGDGPNDQGLSRKHIFEQCHASLRRLQVDYIDLYQCHRYDTSTPLEETCEIMNDIIRAGKVLYWGVSEWNADQIAAAVTLCRARGWAVPVSNQPQYSALWRRIEARVLPVCREYGVGNVVWSPLAMGIVSGKYVDAAHPPAGTRAAGPYRDMMEEYFTQPVLDAVQKLQPLAAQAGISMSQLALAWVLRQSAVTSAIVGATSPAHVKDNAAAASVKLDDELIAAVDRVLIPVAPNEPYLA